MDEEASKTAYKYIVIGGGVAGTTCSESLSVLSKEDDILLLTASPLIKAVTNFRKLTKTLDEFDVEERPMFDLHSQFPNIHVVHKTVASLSAQDKSLLTTDGTSYTYERLCICAGGSPKVIADDSPFVLGIRDTETVKVFQKKLTNAKRIVIVGNGGIATELVHEIEGCEIVWAIKDSAITHTFIDEAASQFLLPIINQDKDRSKVPVKRTKYRMDDDVSSTTDRVTEHGDTVYGGALGPDWAEGTPMFGAIQESRRVHIEYKVEVKRLLSPEELRSQGLQPSQLPLLSDTTDEWPVYVELTNGSIYGCDFVVSATGVNPSTEIFAANNQFDLSLEDGGFLVNDKMQTSIAGVYAAGDVCHAAWEHSPYWIQMRLWSQARQMGAHAARCMVADLQGELDDVQLDFAFEVFAHVTKFFNFKVVLLGKFNAQGLGKDHELLVRVTKGEEFVKAVLKDGKMYGAILIGDTDLEETFENLILNQMDLTAFKDNLLNPDIDIEDFFD